MRPVHHNMYGAQPAYMLSTTPGPYPPTNPVPPQYGRSQDPPPMYLVHHQPVSQYAAVGVPSQVVGNPMHPHMPQVPAVAMVPTISGYAQGWPYRPPVAEPTPSTPVWGYGGYHSGGYAPPPREEESRMPPSWHRPPPPQGHPGNGASGAPVSYQGRGGEGYGGGGGSGAYAAAEGRRPERGMDSSGGRQYPPSGAASRPPMARQVPPPPPSPAASQAKPLTCEACEKTFPIASQMTAHMNTHVACDEVGCSFSASGKVLKLHKQSVHSKPSNSHSAPASKGPTASKASDESHEEIKSWREERKRNYPTRSNIQRKKEEMQGRLERGELIDEDARRRRQRLKEILAKQAELGVPVAEVPAHYLSQPKDQKAHRAEHSDRMGAHNRKETQRAMAEESATPASGDDGKKRKHGEHTGVEDDQPVKVARANPDPSCNNPHNTLKPQSEAELDGPAEAEPAVKGVEGEEGEEGNTRPSGKNAKQPCYFYQRGRCRKGAKCHYAHSGPPQSNNKKGGGEGKPARGRVKGGGALDKKRAPTLLAKLLETSVLRDKSYILQCLRFFANNNFLVDWPKQSPSACATRDAHADTSEEGSDISDGEVVEAGAPDVLAADSAIISCLLSESPNVLAAAIHGPDEDVGMETEA